MHKWLTDVSWSAPARLIAAWFLITAAAADTDHRVVVDTARASLVVLAGERRVLELDDIAIGRFGATAEKRRGDRMTPLGSYRVAWIKADGEFGTFVGIDYPSVADAERGLRSGLISPAEHRAILSAHRRGRLPPQDTALGGYLGIHGLGDGDPAIHATYNWTRGCIAVTNRQLAALLRWVEPGIRVDIR